MCSAVVYSAAVLLPLRLPAAAVDRVIADPSPSIWRPASDLMRLFTPGHVPSGVYAAYTSALPLEAALKEIQGDPALSSWPGAWNIQTSGPFDAFGQGGPYNRWTVAQLYGAATARVARGPRIEEGRVIETWTLISPYPDGELRHLEQGTLLLVLRLHSRTV